MSVYSIPVGSVVGDLSNFEHQYVLIVNIADGCGFAPQLQDLEQLHRDSNIPCTVVAFPSNQFNQQLRQNDDMRQWCTVEQRLSFPVESQVNVNGADTHALFAYLKDKARGALGQKHIIWNYTKFLIYPNESAIIRFSPKTSIAKIQALITGLS